MKSIKSVLTSKLPLELLDSFLLGHHGRGNCFNWRARHWSIYPPPPHWVMVEGWIQGFWLVLHLALMCLTSRELPKQWAVLILEECQRIGAGKWHLLQQSHRPRRDPASLSSPGGLMPRLLFTSVILFTYPVPDSGSVLPHSRCLINRCSLSFGYLFYSFRHVCAC